MAHCVGKLGFGDGHGGFRPRCWLELTTGPATCFYPLRQSVSLLEESPNYEVGLRKAVVR